MSSFPRNVLVTGATGFIGAHVVDELLRRGHKVRAATRSEEKGKLLKNARTSYNDQLEIFQIKDFSNAVSFKDAVEQVDGIIHVASPFDYSVQDNENQLVKPAIAGVQAVMEAAAANPGVKRVVITSSFASVLDVNRKSPPHFTYTSADWNPLSYEESIDKDTSAVVAYRGSKKFAELEAWNFVKKHNPTFDLVTLCPPMTFGPICHPVTKIADLNESNNTLWKVASGQDLPVARVPFWVDVRDLAVAHVEALLRPEVGGKRFTVASPDKFSYSKVADIVSGEFDWGEKRVTKGKRQEIDESHDLDGETAGTELGVRYRSFRQTVKDFIEQAAGLEQQERK
ncbi:NAD dependent epimerase/dehydratase [Periconia macrospinosa]|uniref:NAD dependent epimerase/dehydratase n=1 Tax=Periconia macrospinosa TaxID=97972 RepID=A0A2V1DN34_9PLEO|nr:NAD dependent epimerase/dehydratase [Periconia macrospinosa]